MLVMMQPHEGTEANPLITLFLLYFIAIIGVSILGRKRTIGFWGAFFISLFFTPAIGLIVVLVSGSKKKEIQSIPHQQQTIHITNNPSSSIYDEINKLKILKDDGLLTEEEFEIAKKRLLTK